MTYAIVYSSRTGNTERLAQALRQALPAADCLYYGPPSAQALSAERIYAGFWTDKGVCDGQAREFLATLQGKEVFLFGTAGFGGSPDYFQHILQGVAQALPSLPSMRSGRPRTRVRMPLSRTSSAMRARASAWRTLILSTGCAMMPQESVAATPMRASP